MSEDRTGRELTAHETGSEVTPWATLWDRSSDVPKKYSLHVAQTWPEAALVDPALARSAPASVTRNSALDALSHALESIWNVNQGLGDRAGWIGQ